MAYVNFEFPTIHDDIKQDRALFNTLPNRSLALLLAGPDLGDKIYNEEIMAIG